MRAGLMVESQSKQPQDLLTAEILKARVPGMEEKQAVSCLLCSASNSIKRSDFERSALGCINAKVRDHLSILHNLTGLVGLCIPNSEILSLLKYSRDKLAKNVSLMVDGFGFDSMMAKSVQQ